MANLHVAKLYCKGKYQLNENQFYYYKIRKTEFESISCFFQYFSMSLHRVTCIAVLGCPCYSFVLYVSKYLMATTLDSFIEHF